MSSTASATLTTGTPTASAAPAANVPAAGRSATAVSGSPAPAPVTAGSLDRMLSLPALAPLQGVLQQPAVRRLLPLILMMLVLIIFGLTYLSLQSSPYRPVMPGLHEADQQAAFDALKGAEFQPRIDAASGQLMVPADRYHEARIFLAAQGLPRAGTTGLDALKDQSSMTTSQFMEQVRVNAAMEQELARSIMQIGSVLGARVHLATPKQSVFVRDRVPPKASVVITPHPGRMVAPMQVQAIVHLVSSSVPYLAPENVTVVDNLGKLMTESASELKLGLTAAQQQHKQQLEEVYRNRILQILSPMVGEANVRTQVNLTLDFTEVESTTEDFDTRGKGPRTRSEVLSEDNSTQPRPEGIPGALSNTPPQQPLATATAQVNNTNDNQADTTRSEQQTRSSSRATRNYELDRSVRHVRNPRGEVTKVSVAVVVNERAATNAAADAPKTTPFTQEELDGMLRLVRGVISFDESRGDLVSVVPARFEPLALSPQEFLPWYLEDSVQTAIKSGLIALSFIVFLLIVVRPVMNGLFGKHGSISDEVQARALTDGELTEEELRMIQIGEGESIEEIKARLKPKKSSISVDMLDTANTYDDKVALIRMLVAEDSGRVANVLKSMMKNGS